MRDDITNIAIEDYLAELMPPRPQALAELERHAREHGWPLVGPVEGQLLYLLAKMHARARRWKSAWPPGMPLSGCCGRLHQTAVA